MPAVLYETRDRIAFITLNRPEVLNAFNREMHQRLREAWLAFREDEDAWVAVVTGAGDRSVGRGMPPRAPASDASWTAIRVTAPGDGRRSRSPARCRPSRTAA